MDENVNGSIPTAGKWDGGPNALALVVVVVAGGVLWRQIANSVSWWWDKANDMTGSGEVVLFALGLFAALVMVLLAMVALEKLFRFARDLRRSMAKGWHRAGESR